SPAGGTGPETAGLDQQHRPGARVVAGRGRGHTEDPAAHDQHVGVPRELLRDTGAELGQLARLPLISPVRLVATHPHPPIPASLSPSFSKLHPVTARPATAPGKVPSGLDPCEFAVHLTTANSHRS